MVARGRTGGKVPGGGLEGRCQGVDWREGASGEDRREGASGEDCREGARGRTGRNEEIISSDFFFTVPSCVSKKEF